MPFRESGADRVILRDGGTLQGLVLDQTPRGALVAVEWAWLERHDGQRAARWRAAWIATERKRREDLLRRIDAWLVERHGDDELVSFLQAERRRLDRSEPDPSKYRLLLRLVPANRIRRLQRADEANRKVYWAAWVSGKQDVCSRPVAHWRKKLLPAALEAGTDLVDLLPHLSPLPDTEATFRLRKALVEFSYRKPLVFQGTPQMWLATDAQGQPKMPTDLSGLLQRMAGDLLGGAGGRGGGAAGPLRSAAETADKAHVSGFLVKELDLVLGAAPRKVSVRFYVKMPDGRWQPVSRFVEPIRAGDARRAQELGQDPQVKQAIDLARSLGIKIDPGQLQVALGAGAGVDKALRTADSRFLRLQQAYANSLDVPLFQRGR